MKKIHVNQSVKGALMNWKEEEWDESVKYFTTDGKKLSSGRDLKKLFIDLVADGVFHIPIGECDNFDPKIGCLGHETEKED